MSRVGLCRDLGAVSVELDAGDRTILLHHRGWNPVLAIVEAAWTISGSNKLDILSSLIPRFSQYSDDGLTLNGAYGHRLRHHFCRDQLEECIKELKRHPDSRRVVLSLYSVDDLGSASKDIPCNTQVALRRVGGRLEMTVSNRSNDLWLGVPYNWFVFHLLQQLIADRLKISCGIQRHVSSCVHLYEQDWNAANDVLRGNTAQDLANLESNLTPLDVKGILENVVALADLSFDRLSSLQLHGAFHLYCRIRGAGELPNDIQFARDVIAVSLERWFQAHRSAPEANSAQISTVACLVPPGLRIIRWIESVELSDAVNQLRSIAMENSEPLIRELLQRNVGQGVTIRFANTGSQQQASLQFLLQVILGALKTELERTHIGDILLKKIIEIASLLGIANFEARRREVGDEVLERLFCDLRVSVAS